MPKIPGVGCQGAIRALKKAGFSVIRQGDHVIMSNGAVIVSIPTILLCSAIW